MERVERAMDHQGNAFSLFQTAITLEGQVRARTEELTLVLRSLERTNAQLSLAKEEAERANLSKTRFLAAAGHDLLEPVGAAKFCLAALSDMEQSSESRRLLAQVGGSLQTIEDLIKTLLDISRLDAGVLQPEMRAFNLDDLLLSLRATFAPIAAAKGLRFRVRLCGLTVRNDPLLLQRVLQNLASNAVRYTARGGVLIGARRRGLTCLLDVQDTGFGILESERERIFDEFYRGTAAPRAGQMGLGLGLSIVRRITQSIGCELSVSSTVNKGSRFRVALPLSPDAADAARPEDASLDAAGSLNGAVVMIVENDPTVAAEMERVFRRWGSHPLVARNLDEADAAIAAGDRLPDILVADYHLDGGETGLGAMERLRRWDPDLPTLIVTADDSAATAQAVRATGAELMQKPVTLGKLRAVASHLASRKR
ncbi:MAG: hybrid sensor histidine kinase/response regulator [Hyphomicrobiales bacterium]|nr:hybrid sensor histidine kinase/response regulator [Hyphomicrobiales bacterium]